MKIIMLLYVLLSDKSPQTLKLHHIIQVFSEIKISLLSGITSFQRQSDLLSNSNNNCSCPNLKTKESPTFAKECKNGIEMITYFNVPFCLRSLVPLERRATSLSSHTKELEHHNWLLTAGEPF